MRTHVELQMKVLRRASIEDEARRAWDDQQARSFCISLYVFSLEGMISTLVSTHGKASVIALESRTHLQ